MALPQPKGKQLEVLDLKPEGHNVVLGTAGSGKTTLAIYRAIYLATLDDKEKVMLVTFNTTLVKYLEAIVGSEIPRNIEVRNYHKFARGYLAHRNKMPRWNGIVSGMEDGDNKKQLFVRRALENVKAVNGTNSTLKRAEEVFLEEINWIEKMGIKTLDEYEKVERVGRFDTRIIRENRKYFFQVYKAYLEVRKEEGYLYDWEDIAQTVCEELENDTEKRMYKHIIVDEGQDLSPIMLKSLVKAIPEDGTFTFFGDVAQQIYGSRLSWREAGLKIAKNKIWYFDRNYRNSKEIAQFAVAISKSKYFEDKQDLVEPVLPTASSPLPAIVKCKDEEAELDWIVEAAIRMSGNQSIAILVRNRELVDLVEEKLRAKKIIPQILKNRMGVLDLNAKISIGTYHSAKGLEFDMVFLPFCSMKYLPSEERVLANESRDEALKEETKLLKEIREDKPKRAGMYVKVYVWKTAYGQTIFSKKIGKKTLNMEQTIPHTVEKKHSPEIQFTVQKLKDIKKLLIKVSDAADFVEILSEIVQMKIDDDISKEKIDEMKVKWKPYKITKKQIVSIYELL